MKKTLSLLLALCLLLTLFITASHAEATVPDLTITRKAIPENEAMEFLKKMGVGWNLGNTFDAVKDKWTLNADEMMLEAYWVNVKTTEDMIEALHAAGFTSIRIPISWHDHVTGPDHEISEKWLSRVQEVVNWAYDRGMYVIINIHHDEDQFLPTSAHYEESAHYMECVWRQLAERFKDYDEHLIMESLNEPRLLNSDYEWVFDPNAPECLDAADCLNRLNQLFVDTVRASGGNNAERYLMVPAYDAGPGNAVRDSFVLPTDSADNKIIVSVHAYTPYDFALNQNGGGSFGAQNQKADIVGFMNSLYNKYTVNGIPVVIGEFGAVSKGDNLQDRVDWAAFYVVSASARNMPCLWWDNNVFAGDGERFGLLDRNTLTFPQQVLVDAIMRYGGWDKLPEAQ